MARLSKRWTNQIINSNIIPGNMNGWMFLDIKAVNRIFSAILPPRTESAHPALH